MAHLDVCYALFTLKRHLHIHGLKCHTILFCQPRVEVTSCFVYKVMGLTFHDRINTQLIYRIAVAQVVTRRINKPLRTFLGSNLTGCYFSFNFFFWGGGGRGWRQWFIYKFGLMCPGTRCFPYQWVPAANLWVQNTIPHDKSAISVHPGTR